MSVFCDVLLEGQRHGHTHLTRSMRLARPLKYIAKTKLTYDIKHPKKVIHIIHRAGEQKCKKVLAK
jgi:hypothetical protein